MSEVVKVVNNVTNEESVTDPLPEVPESATCADGVCPEGTTCADGVCCPEGTTCADGVCPDGTTCPDGVCCPEGVCPEGNPCVDVPAPPKKVEKKPVAFLIDVESKAIVESLGDLEDFSVSNLMSVLPKLIKHVENYKNLRGAQKRQTCN